MIQAIGIMLGFYIAMQAAVVFDVKEGNSAGVRFLAAVTFTAAVFMTAAVMVG